MRRTPSTLATTAAAAAALLLAGCDGGSDSSAPDDPAPATVAPDDGSDDDADDATDDDATTAPGAGESEADDQTGAATTQVPGDDAQQTGDPLGGEETEEVMGGEEGQAAADRAKEFLMALVAADPEACELLLSFSDPEQPMTAIESDLELCQTQLPATMEATVEAQGLGEDGIAVLEAMTITGADVSEDGRTAVVGRDNYSPLFAEAMGDSTITLKNIDDEWYVDLDAYLVTE